ncbi:ATP synthase F1 subunit delta [Bacteroidota bacterium]
MSAINITSRYAKALIELAEEKKSLEEVSKDIRLVYDTFSISKELKSVMASPVLRNDKKAEILKAIFQKNIKQDVMNFLLFVVDKRREEYLFAILKRYLELHDDKMGIVNANVSSPAVMNDAQIKKLSESLQKFTGKKVKINTKESKDLIGGFVVKIGDTVIDASVDHQLEMLKKKFLEEQTIATN